MKIEELVTAGNLPDKAGVANLVWSGEWSRGVPSRNANDIILPIPRDPKAELYSLQSGGQYLLCSEGQTLFFGTDEKPFLTGLAASARQAIDRGGERGFYRWLKPWCVQQFEQLGLQVKRQGDIFAVALPRLRDKYFAGIGSLTVREDRRVQRESLFGTRHLLTGTLVGKMRISWDPDQRLHPVALGTIEAPDHAALKIGGLHALAQANGIVPLRVVGAD